MTWIGLEIKRNKGVYTLIINLAKRANLEVGSLGSCKFEKGWYAYTGSALGVAGLKGRIERHLRTDKICFWHIDYLLQSKHSSVKAIVCAKTNMRYECKIAEEISHMNVKPIKGFGISDCRESCESHLHYVMNGFNETLGSILNAYSNSGLKANSYLLT